MNKRQLQSWIRIIGLFHYITEHIEIVELLRLFYVHGHNFNDQNITSLLQNILYKHVHINNHNPLQL